VQILVRIEAANVSRLSVDRFLDEAGEPERGISAPHDLETGRI
jgi:hypothetical protein